MVATGCGWQPGGPAPQPPDTCAESDSPSAETVQNAIAEVPRVGADWVETGRGHTRNCRLFWVQFALADATAASPEQLLFFDRNTALGPPTEQPKPYTSVVSSGESTVTVQYQWRVDDEPDCCPTGIGTVRFQIGDDGTLVALDPIPNP